MIANFPFSSGDVLEVVNTLGARCLPSQTVVYFRPGEILTVVKVDPRAREGFNAITCLAPGGQICRSKIWSVRKMYHFKILSSGDVACR